MFTDERISIEDKSIVILFMNPQSMCMNMYGLSRLWPNGR